MDSVDPDCVRHGVVEECFQLMNSNASFAPYPHVGKIRLALSHHLKVPLTLTLQRSLCNISCEVGYPNSCKILSENHSWENVSSPKYFFNVTPLHYYCVNATIEDCCPVYTDTLFMEDYQTVSFQVVGFPFNITVVLALLGVLFGFGIFIVKCFFFGKKTTHHRSSNEIAAIPLKQQNLDTVYKIPEVTVLFLYIQEQEREPLFKDTIINLQEFLRSTGLVIINIYNELESINTSIHSWVQGNVGRKNTKIVVVDTNSFRQLWVADPARCMILKPVEQAILYLRSCIHVSDLHSVLFVVRLQENEVSTIPLIHFGVGRSYMFPRQKWRLAEDLCNLSTL